MFSKKVLKRFVNFSKSYFGFVFIHASIELFGRTDLFSWQSLTQMIMIVVGVLLIYTREGK